VYLQPKNQIALVGDLFKTA